MPVAEDEGKQATALQVSDGCPVTLSQGCQVHGIVRHFKLFRGFRMKDKLYFIHILLKGHLRIM